VGVWRWRVLRGDGRRDDAPLLPARLLTAVAPISGEKSHTVAADPV